MTKLSYDEFVKDPTPLPPRRSRRAKTSPKAERPPSRAGKKVISIYIEPEDWEIMKILSAKLEMPLQEIGEEAFSAWRNKHVHRITAWGSGSKTKRAGA